MEGEEESLSGQRLFKDLGGELQRLVESWAWKANNNNKKKKNGTGFCGQMKLKIELFGSKHTRWGWCTHE